jgi:hypothetical protein
VAQMQKVSMTNITKRITNVALSSVDNEPTSRNLTPDADGLPAGLTYAQFRQTMRRGIDQKKAHQQLSPLLQVMPWPVYQDMTERNLRATYEYFRAIPHANPTAGAGATGTARR